MIELYSFGTPNGKKISIMLEECNLPYHYHSVDIGRGEQFEASFLEISPNNKIPVIIDRACEPPLRVFETGAILLYLAEKSGRFFPASQRWEVLCWLMWQVGGLGPMLGQWDHFERFADEKIAYGIERYRNEGLRLHAVLDKVLASRPYVAGSEYTIADIACYPWIEDDSQRVIDLSDFPHVSRWCSVLEARPAVRAGMAVG